MNILYTLTMTFCRVDIVYDSCSLLVLVKHPEPASLCKKYKRQINPGQARHSVF